MTIPILERVGLGPLLQLGGVAVLIVLQWGVFRNDSAEQAELKAWVTRLQDAQNADHERQALFDRDLRALDRNLDREVVALRAADTDTTARRDRELADVRGRITSLETVTTTIQLGLAGELGEIKAELRQIRDRLGQQQPSRP